MAKFTATHDGGKRCRISILAISNGISPKQAHFRRRNGTISMASVQGSDKMDRSPLNELPLCLPPGDSGGGGRDDSGDSSGDRRERREPFTSPPPPSFPFSLSYSSSSSKSSGDKKMAAAKPPETAAIRPRTPDAAPKEEKNGSRDHPAQKNEPKDHGSGDSALLPFLGPLFTKDEQAKAKSRPNHTERAYDSPHLHQLGKVVTEEESSPNERNYGPPPMHHDVRYEAYSPPTGAYQYPPPIDNSAYYAPHPGAPPHGNYYRSREETRDQASQGYHPYYDRSGEEAYDHSYYPHPANYATAYGHNVAPGESTPTYASTHNVSSPSTYASPHRHPDYGQANSMSASTESLKKRTTNHAWDQRLSELVEYKEEHRNTLVPQKYPDNPSLGIWVNKQRMEYKLFQEGNKSSMTLERVRRLEEVGFTWAKRKGPEAWEEKYQELCQYKLKFGDVLVPTKYIKNKALGRWVSTQRAQFRLWEEGKKSSMTAERKDRLEELGFVWRLQF